MSDIIPIAPEPRPLPFRRPADYYSAPESEVQPVVPRGVVYGCGAASLLAILVLFGAGVLAGSSGGGSIFSWMMATLQDEIHGVFTKDVTPAQKAAFDAEMKTLRENLDKKKVSIDRLQPLMSDFREASSDNQVTPAEAEKLTKKVREVNDGVPGSRGREVSPSRPAETPRPRDPATPR